MPDGKRRGGFARLAAVVKAERARAAAAGGQRDLRPCRRHALALADVGHRPGRQHRDADQHGAARHLHARQPRIRFRQGGLPRAHGARRRFRATARTCATPDGATLPDFKDRSIVTVGGVRIGLTGATYEDSPRASDPGDLKFLPSVATLIEQAKALRARGRRLRRRGRACHARAGLRGLSQRCDRSHPHRPHPRSLHQL